MENFSYNSYPESGDSSPRSREIDFENPPPWEDSNFKVKFMCSYGGKIHPRPHDNQLAYVGGETKILSVDRSIKFAHLVSKLSAICDNSEVCFKYQLPGEDLDALISVTNDDDLEHMMHEYDRLYRASSKPARLRLFLFTVSSQTGSFGSGDAKSDRDRFVDALNSGPVQSPVVPPPNNVDFLFGLEKGVAPPPPPVVAAAISRARDPVYSEADVVVQNNEDRIGSDPIQKHIQDLQRLRISDEQQHQANFRRKSDEYYVQKMPEKLTPSQTLPAHLPAQSVPIPANYWPEKQIPGGVYPPSSIGPDHQQQHHHQQQQVYMIPSQPNMYQMTRPITGPPGQTNQGYYMQRMTPEVYRDQPVYNVVSQAPQPTLPPQVVPKTTAFQATSVMDTGYTQVAYDSAGGRQVYYTAPAGVVSQPQGPVPVQYQAVPGYGGDMRAVAGNYSQESGGKAVPVKVSQTSG